MLVRYVFFYLSQNKQTKKITSIGVTGYTYAKNQSNYLNKTFNLMSPVTLLAPFHCQAHGCLICYHTCSPGSQQFPQTCLLNSLLLLFLYACSSRSVRTEHSSTNSGLKVKVSAHVLTADSMLCVLLSETDTSHLHCLPTVLFPH